MDTVHIFHNISNCSVFQVLSRYCVQSAITEEDSFNKQQSKFEWMKNKQTVCYLLIQLLDIYPGCPIKWYFFIISCFRHVDYSNQAFQNVSQMGTHGFKWGLKLNAYF